jgi:hypothetical protein
MTEETLLQRSRNCIRDKAAAMGSLGGRGLVLREMIGIR